MKKTNLVEFTEILEFAEENNYGEWNDLCCLLDAFRPYMEVKAYEIDINSIDDYLDEDSDTYELKKKIITEFMIDYGVKEMIIVDG